MKSPQAIEQTALTSCIEKRDELLKQNLRLERQLTELRQERDYYIGESRRARKKMADLMKVIERDIRPLIASLLNKEKLSRSAVLRMAEFLGMKID